MTTGKFEVSQTADTIRFVFSSTLSNIDRICEKTTDFLSSEIENISVQLFSINLVIREGLTNAVRHGNKNNPEKEVFFSLAIEKDHRLKLTIEDQGQGFDWRKQKQLKTSDDKDHGRGFSIMGTYFNDYSYNERGNILFLEKDISGCWRPSPP